MKLLKVESRGYSEDLSEQVIVGTEPASQVSRPLGE